MSPIIETPRLILRAIDPEADFAPWAEMMGDADTVRHLYTNTCLSPEGAWQNMAAMIGHWHIRGYGFMSVIDKESGAWVGRIGPYNPYGWPEAEVGWAVHPAHTRRGYAAEAGRACVQYCFDVLEWPSVAHVMVAANTPSIKTAETIGARLARRIEPDTPQGRPRLVYRHDTRPMDII